jgi:hypothetical protein
VGAEIVLINPSEANPTESNGGVDKRYKRRYSLSFDAAAFFGSEHAEMLP